MNIEELKQAQKLVETQYNNLSNHTWISGELSYLKGRYELLGELISREESKVEPSTNTVSTKSPKN